MSGATDVNVISVWHCACRVLQENGLTAFVFVYVCDGIEKSSV